MDVAEMKIAGAKKGAAKPDVNVVQGEALATMVVEWAWKRAEEEERSHTKLQLFVKNICDLSPEGHIAFRGQLTQELAALAELDKAAGTKESRTQGYSLNSFRVRVSELKTISEAAQLGKLKATNRAGEPMTWSQAIETAREVRKTKVAAGEGKGGQGKAGRKPLSDYDKAMRSVGKLNLRDLRKVQAAVAGLIDAAELGKRPKA